MTMLTTQRALICKGCWQQLHLPVPLRGPWSVPFRMVGLKPSRMNPNTCTLCELMFTRLMQARNIALEATVLFADLRGFAALARESSSEAMSALLDSFYDECATAIWEHDGLLNTTVGDGVMAIFNFPIHQADHASQALHAARAMQQRYRALRAAMPRGSNQTARLEIGIGIDSGTVRFGEFGHPVRELTTIGTVANTAARAQAAAAAGEILITRAARNRIGPLLDEPTPRTYALKGFSQPVELFAA